MAFLARCAAERIPLLLAEGAIDDEGERLQALAALAEVSLVKHDPFDDDTEAVTVHRLVQTVARIQSADKGLAQTSANRLNAQLAAIYPIDGYNNPKSWALCAQLTPHLVAQRGAADYCDEISNPSEGRPFKSGGLLLSWTCRIPASSIAFARGDGGL
jgi:hypothetical protein